MGIITMISLDKLIAILKTLVALLIFSAFLVMVGISLTGGGIYQ
jgi:hypothetical protein